MREITVRRGNATFTFPAAEDDRGLRIGDCRGLAAAEAALLEIRERLRDSLKAGSFGRPLWYSNGSGKKPMRRHSRWDLR